MKKLFLHLIAIFFPAVLILLSCADPIDLTEEERKLREDATHNQSVIPGAGNLFLEERLEPNAPSQLLAKLAYNGDTVAYFGSIDGSGQLEAVHSMVYYESNSSILVTQVFPEMKMSRKYRVTAGVKSNLVEITEVISEKDFIISIVDYDWGTHDYETLQSQFVSNGSVIATIPGGGRTSEETCPETNRSGDLQDDIDADISDYSCWAQWGSGHLLNYGTAALRRIAELLPSRKKEIDEIIALREKDGAAKDNTANGFEDLRHNTEPLKGDLKDLEDQYQTPIDESNILPQLIMRPDLSDLQYDEATDPKIRVGYFIGRSGDGQNYPKAVYVSVGIFKIGDNKPLTQDMKVSDPASGTVTFEFDPSTIPRDLETVRVYAHLFVPGANEVERQVTLKFMLPPTVMANQTTSIRPTSAKLAGEVTDDGNAVVTDRGFCYSNTNTTPTVQDSKVIAGSGKGAFTADITGLEKNVRYYVRAYAVNAKGLSYSVTRAFDTPLCDPALLHGSWRIQDYYRDSNAPNGYVASTFYWDVQFLENGTVKLKASTEQSVTSKTYTFANCRFTYDFFGCTHSIVLQEGVTQYTITGCGGFHHHTYTKL